VSTPGIPKSDFHFIDDNMNEIAWISHKYGKNERRVHQYGGTSKRIEPKVCEHIETQQFIQDCLNLFPNGIPNKTTIAKRIVCNNLKLLSIYGNEFGQSMSRQNVSVFIQGDINLMKRNSVYVLSANHVHWNGDLLTGNYEPVFFATYKGDRSDHGLIGRKNYNIAPWFQKYYTMVIERKTWLKIWQKK
jgi:hypothetical protein